MIYSLETGYFIWNFPAWIGLYVFSSLIFCLLIYVIKSKVEVSFVGEDKAAGKDGSEQNENFEDVFGSFRKKCFDPWFEQPIFHLLAVAALFVLFLIALFSSMGVE